MTFEGPQAKHYIAPRWHGGQMGLTGSVNSFDVVCRSCGDKAVKLVHNVANHESCGWYRLTIECSCGQVEYLVDESW